MSGFEGWRVFSFRRRSQGSGGERKSRPGSRCPATPGRRVLAAWPLLAKRLALSHVTQALREGARSGARLACAWRPGRDPSPGGRRKKLRLEWVSERLGARSGSHALFVQQENGGPAGSEGQCIVRGSGSPVPSPSQPGFFNQPPIHLYILPSSPSFHPSSHPLTHLSIHPTPPLLWSCCDQGQRWEEG